MFIPTTMPEVKALGWDRLEIILVTGDTYIDSPFMGVSMIGKLLSHQGFKVGIIAQPDLDTAKDILRLGSPSLFWGVTGGAVDSMVANYTAVKKRRQKDDYTPGHVNNRRPDRAVIAYANLIRRFCKPTAPIVIGGIEASLRRIAHYDFWSNRIRRSILFDAKADVLVFGMGHATICPLAHALKQDLPFGDIPGIAYISKAAKGLELPSFETVSQSKSAYIDSFKLFYANTDPITGQGLCQAHNDRYLILNPPAPVSTTQQMDAIHDLAYEHDVHPFYRTMGPVRALDTIRFAIPTHFGCYGECRFCAITVHQGRTVQSRSVASIIRQAQLFTTLADFKGNIMDLGGPTANMYGYECQKKLSQGACRDKGCLKKVFVNSGIRYDLILHDKKHGMAFLEKLVKDHVSGQMKVAPEHCEKQVLCHMGKQTIDDLLAFKSAFDKISHACGKPQFLTYYLMAAHPGCTQNDMAALKQFTSEKLNTNPEQVQIFTPTPSTYSTLMYYTGQDPFTGKPLFVEKDPAKKQRQKDIVTARTRPNKIRRAKPRRKIK
ncbi:MAG: YgiQ family radical SAM protein [Desulfobacteraceae bacterium]|nr:YgiQ family radical SAM protein [Desulfobacteraceae bacterium]